MAERIIFHCDCNSYFASVELLKHPELREKPVAVSGSVDSRHGIVLAKNDPAKRFGVKTAETIWQARKKCPELVLLSPHSEEYRKYSQQINAIYSGLSDCVEPFGIDESWLDMTGSWQLFGDSPHEVADELRETVKRETGLSISVGVSYNKIFAKLASDYKKPDATTEIPKDKMREMIWPLPVSDLLFVGQRAAGHLEEIGINTIGELALTEEKLLQQVLGKQGTQLWQYANGLDQSPVARVGEREPVKSVGNGRTFRRDLLGYRDIRTAVGFLADEVAARLRRKNLYATSLQVLIKDVNLKSISRQKPLPYSSYLAKDIVINAMNLIDEHWDMAKPIRMLTLTAQNLTEMPFDYQMSLFEENKGLNPKREKLEKSMDKIRDKYGKCAILEANTLHNSIGLETRAESDVANKK